jgi:hypothetical protein
MEQRREFLIPRERLMELAMELATLLHSHEGMCRWLGPYEKEDGENDFVADYYKDFFEERISFLLLTISLLLRTLDDRGLIDNYTKRDDPRQIELGKIRINGQWVEIDNFRTVLNFVIHAKEVIPTPKATLLDIKSEAIAGIRELKSLGGSILLLGEHKGTATTMQLELQPYCDMTFRVVERLADR